MASLKKINETNWSNYNVGRFSKRYIFLMKNGNFYLYFHKLKSYFMHGLQWHPALFIPRG